MRRNPLAGTNTHGLSLSRFASTPTHPGGYPSQHIDGGSSMARAQTPKSSDVGKGRWPTSASTPVEQSKIFTPPKVSARRQLVAAGAVQILVARKPPEASGVY